MPQCITDFKDKSWMFIFIFFIEQNKASDMYLATTCIYICARELNCLCSVLYIYTNIYIYIYIYKIHIYMDIFSSVQSFSHVRLLATPWTTAHQASLYITNSQSPPKPMSIESVMPSNHLILDHSLLLVPSIFSSIRAFSDESALCIRWPKYWSFSFNISPSNEHPGLISFEMDWLDLLAVRGTLESSPTPQFNSTSSLVLSFLYSPTLTSIPDYWKNHSLD